MTFRDYVCIKCANETRAGNLFDALRNFRDGTPNCEKCGGLTELYLRFPFELGIGRTTCRVLDVFVPARPARWNSVTFYPFLVILRRGRTTACWLPYWHLHGAKRKYGQWAPLMNESIFRNLLSQAKKKGYLG